VTLRPDDLVPLGDITTPAFAPIRFATSFFLAHLPPQQRVDVWPGELDEGYWSTAAAVLDDWERGRCLVSPPTVMTLRAIRGRSADEAPARLAPLLRALAGGAIHPIFFAPDVRMIPLRTPALPPSAYTNAYLVGTGPVYLLDPGAAEPDEQQRLFDILDLDRDTHRRLTAVVLSHHHPDHIAAARACAQRYDVPVWAHASTARLLEGRVPVSRMLHDGDRLSLGTAADGNPWHLEVLHTPGHASGHLAFYEAHYRLLFAGDMVSTLSSVVIAPPDGDLAVYLDSLRRLRTFRSRLLMPSHGNVSAVPEQAIDECLAHRAKREEMLLAALNATPRPIADLTVELYKGLPADMMRFAELQTLAGLQKLEREGRAEPIGDAAAEGWRLRPNG
jgi:glyoxylase-like metal-dependent hydrolase (beta-lactamase superfamily II)